MIALSSLLMLTQRAFILIGHTCDISGDEILRKYFLIVLNEHASVLILEMLLSVSLKLVLFFSRCKYWIQSHNHLIDLS